MPNEGAWRISRPFLGCASSSICNRILASARNVLIFNAFLPTMDDPSESEINVELSPTLSPALHGQMKIAGEGLAVLFLGIIAAISTLPGAALVFFPELGALAYDVFTRPRGSWASSLIFLALTPVVTAVFGIACSLWMPYGYVSVIVIVGISVVMVQVLRSPIAPAISAGVLPLVLGLKSWWYPPAILVGTVSLALLCWTWRSWCSPRMEVIRATHRERVDDIIELAPRRWHWAPALLIFLVIAVTAVKLTGLRLILFPPLVVIGFEMFAHPSICPWARRPVGLPIACFLAAAAGHMAVTLLGVGVLSTVIGLVIGILVLRGMDLHIPPALAIAIIPQVLNEPSWTYPLAVFIGTALLTTFFLVYRRLLIRFHRLA